MAKYHLHCTANVHAFIRLHFLSSSFSEGEGEVEEKLEIRNHTDDESGWKKSESTWGSSHLRHKFNDTPSVDADTERYRKRDNSERMLR